MQVCLYTCGDLIASVPFFENSEEGFTTSLVTLLRPAVRMFPLSADNVADELADNVLLTLIEGYTSEWPSLVVSTKLGPVALAATEPSIKPLPRDSITD